MTWLSFDRRLAVVTLAPLVLLTANHSFNALPASALAIAALLSTPHVLATTGLYLQRDLRAVIHADVFRCVVVPALAFVAVLLTFGLTSGRTEQALLVGVFLWQTHHFTKQNIGVAAFWVRARGLGLLTGRERQVISATTTVGVLGIIRASGVAPGFDSELRAIALVLVATLAAAAFGVTSGPRRAMLLASVAFYVPLHLVPADVFAAAFAYQAAHGAQYYLMVGQTIRGDRLATRVTIPLVLLGGLALLAVGTTTALPAHGWIRAASVGLVVVHFLADARLWRLRNPLVRQQLSRRFAFV